ncbi:KxYKxGKxW signal peptide domain-containing protein [Limosilactobacillus antri]|uniref:KxYKxGKxW signal domain protein n=1 Tax=Limosilactobacillus antri DSM 16041 TaxID=525309 RepID=C8P8F4_9LACO|nr:KxYKxGKxW signal peptide domain-containing protein [Limosilactobacillus antri]EEW53252.1 KxYKxGKxW signal domain protein [Limosilactobacillus antri DSM 16041]KRK55067.1 hypothetical protein FC31_GL001595 [Limosilactobacillus antri DSM 16041]
MTKINRYKLYKHKKQWVIGCSSLLLPLLLGVTAAHADEAASLLANQQAQPAQVDQSTVASTSGQPAGGQLTSPVLPAKTAPAATTESTASSPSQIQPSGANDQPSSSHHPADWSHNYERIIWIDYYDHYDTDGGPSDNDHHREKNYSNGRKRSLGGSQLVSA